MQIRLATMEELLTVYDLLNALRKESIWGTVPVEPILPYVHSQLLTILHDPRQHLTVADLDGELVGVCGVELSSHRFLPGLIYLQEWALYIKPRCRSLGIGKALWREALQWGKAQGAYGAVYGRVHAKHSHTMVEEVIWRVFVKEPTHA